MIRVNTSNVKKNVDLIILELLVRHQEINVVCFAFRLSTYLPLTLDVLVPLK